MVHPYEIRRLSIDEIKALASFPATFHMEGSYNERWARIGNSVPPLFMRAIAIHLRREILKGKTHESLGTVRLPDREDVRRESC